MSSKYQSFVKSIDIDEFEDAIGFEPMGSSPLGEDHGQCPDPWGLHKHGDRTGKFAINREKRVFNCFVCGGGTLLSLTMAIRDCDEEEAADWLYQFASKANQTNEDFYNEVNNILHEVERRKEKETLPWFNDNVLSQWIGQDHAWFAERGISDEVRDQYKIGVNLEAVRKSANGEFKSTAIVLPHFFQNRLVGWQNRWMGERPKWVPKYTNTNDFPKKTTVFGLDQAVAKIQETGGPVVAVESVPTVLFLATLGIPAVATFGATITHEQMAHLVKFNQGVILARDNDEAGWAWSRRVSDHLERFVPVAEMEVCWEDDLGETRMVENPEVVIGLYNNPVYSLLP